MATPCRLTTLSRLPALSEHERLESVRSCLRAVLVLLSGTATHAGCALYDAVANDGDRSLAGDHVATFCGYNPSDDGGIGVDNPTGPSQSGRGYGFALAAIYAAPYGAVHTTKGHQATTAIAHGHAYLDVELVRLGYRRLDDAIGFR
jgi:hypothetical protein